MCLNLFRVCRARCLTFRCSPVRLVTLADNSVTVAIDNFALRSRLWLNAHCSLMQFEETRPDIIVPSQLTSRISLPHRCHSLTAARRQQK